MSATINRITNEDLHIICDILGIEKHRYCNKTEMLLKIRYKFSNEHIEHTYNHYYNQLKQKVQETVDTVFPQQDNMWDLLTMDIKDCINRALKQSDKKIEIADAFMTKAALYVSSEDLETIDILRILEISEYQNALDKFCDYIVENPEVNFTEMIRNMKKDEQQKHEKKSQKQHENKHFNGEKKSFKQHENKHFNGEKKSFKQHNNNNNNGQKQNNDQHNKFNKNKFNKYNKFNKHNKFNNNKQQ